MAYNLRKLAGPNFSSYALISYHFHNNLTRTRYLSRNELFFISIQKLTDEYFLLKREIIK